MTRVTLLFYKIKVSSNKRKGGNLERIKKQIKVVQVLVILVTLVTAFILLGFTG